MTWIWLRRGNLNSENESLLIVAQNNAIRTNYIQMKIDNNQQNKVKVKLTPLVEGDPMIPFSIATTPKCRGGCYSIPWIVLLYPWSLPYNAEC